MNLLYYMKVLLTCHIRRSFGIRTVCMYYGIHTKFYVYLMCMDITFTFNDQCDHSLANLSHSHPSDLCRGKGPEAYPRELWAQGMLQTPRQTYKFWFLYSLSTFDATKAWLSHHWVMTILLFCCRQTKAGKFCLFTIIHKIHFKP